MKKNSLMKILVVEPNCRECEEAERLLKLHGIEYQKLTVKTGAEAELQLWTSEVPTLITEEGSYQGLEEIRKYIKARVKGSGPY